MSRRAILAAVLCGICVLLALYPWLATPRTPSAPPARTRMDAGSRDAGLPEAMGDAAHVMGGASGSVKPTHDAKPPERPKAVCLPHARKGCRDGDVYWFDSCGAAGERIEACEGRACLEVACAPTERLVNRCGSVTAYGRCDGDLAQACVGGRVVTVDCARDARRCVLGLEGVRCEAPTANSCTGREGARCEASRLVQCYDGKLTSTDCARHGGKCVTSGGEASCRGSNAALAPPRLEVCNGRDDDDDHAVDEGQVCETVRLVPLVALTSLPPDFEERIARELALLKRIYAPHDFRWEPLRAVSQRLARFPAEALDRVAAALNADIRAALGDTFFVPVLFVDSLDLEPPKGGISTLPNHRCGGVRVSDAPAPATGLLVLADQRMPETLAHELGHYLGLCHTHEQIEHFAFANPDAAACAVTGDGICDTAYDPGPSACRPDATCTVLCDDAQSQPLGADLMSYYLGCRRGLSAEQLAEAERTLALRRGWARCPEPQSCPCTPGDAAACPVEMSCRPGPAQGFGCRLDGPNLVGAVCSDSAECGAAALCLRRDGAELGRCTRACAQSSPDCDCAEVGAPFRVCRQDFGGRSL